MNAHFVDEMGKRKETGPKGDPQVDKKLRAAMERIEILESKIEMQTQVVHRRDQEPVASSAMVKSSKNEQLAQVEDNV